MDMAPLLLTRSRRLNAGFRTARQAGFALLVTLSLMVLLMVLAIGMLSLAAIEMRVAGNAHHLSIARSNARLSLALAIGEIQKQLGPDQRVTAPSGILDAGNTDGAGLNHARLTGVWRSRQEPLGEIPDYHHENAEPPPSSAPPAP